MLYASALLALSFVLTNGDDCTDSNLNEFSWRCSSDEQYEKLNPFELDQPNEDRLIIGLVGTDAENKQQRVQIAQDECTAKFGNDRYFEDPILTNYPNIKDFTQWLYFDGISEEEIQKSTQLQWRRNKCATLAKYLGNVCHLSRVNLCSRKTCERVKKDNEIQGECEPNGFYWMEDRDQILDEFFQVKQKIALCVLDDFYVCQKGAKIIFKTVNAFNADSGIEIYKGTVENVNIDISDDKKQCKLQTNFWVTWQQFMVTQKMILDDRTHYVWNFNFKSKGWTKSCSYGIGDLTAIEQNERWQSFFLLENTVGFFINEGHLYYNEEQHPVLGDFLTSGEEITLRYDAGKDSMTVYMPHRGIEHEFLKGWSTFANADSEFHMFFDCVMFFAEVNFQLTE